MTAQEYKQYLKWEICEFCIKYDIKDNQRKYLGMVYTECNITNATKLTTNILAHKIQSLETKKQKTEFVQQVIDTFPNIKRATAYKLHKVDVSEVTDLH